MAPRYNLRSDPQPHDSLVTVYAKNSKATRTERARLKADLAPFRFLDLPCEIRLQIYRICFRSASPLFIAQNAVRRHKSPCNVRLDLLRVCTTTYREGLPILFSRNRFTMAAKASAGIQRHLQDIGSLACAFVTDLTVILDEDMPHSLAQIDWDLADGHAFLLWEQIRQSCTRLTCLTLDCKQDPRAGVWALADVLQAVSLRGKAGPIRLMHAHTRNRISFRTPRQITAYLNSTWRTFARARYHSPGCCSTFCHGNGNDGISRDNGNINLGEHLKEIRFLHGLEWQDIEFMAKHMGGKQWSIARGGQKKSVQKRSREHWEEIRFLRAAVGEESWELLRELVYSMI